MLKGFDAFMLRPTEEVKPVLEVQPARPYTDPLLKNNVKKYSKLVNRALSIGLVELSLDCICELGVCFSFPKRTTGFA